jgi:ribonuclease BN (tRNA processing enzyme)
MKLVLLGTGGYYCNDRRHTACLMLPEVGVVLDAGSALFRVRDYLATARLSIYLTHSHLDHVVGLTYLLDVLSPAILSGTTVFGEPDKLKTVREHLFNKGLFPVVPPFHMQPIGTTCPLQGGGKLTSFPVKHPGGALGFRLDWPGHSLAYVTDTTASPEAPYVDQICGVDLLVHEAFLETDENDMSETIGHSCVDNVAQVAARAQVRELVLVHMSPRLLDDANFDLAAAQEIFPNTRLGCDKLELEF